jgi:hypothetical protein
MEDGTSYTFRAATGHTARVVAGTASVTSATTGVPFSFVVRTVSTTDLGTAGTDTADADTPNPPSSSPLPPELHKVEHRVMGAIEEGCRLCQLLSAKHRRLGNDALFPLVAGPQPTASTPPSSKGGGSGSGGGGSSTGGNQQSSTTDSRALAPGSGAARLHFVAGAGWACVDLAGKIMVYSLDGSAVELNAAASELTVSPTPGASEVRYDLRGAPTVPAAALPHIAKLEAAVGLLRSKSKAAHGGMQPPQSRG